MRPLSPQFPPYGWALSTREIAERAGIEPGEVLRFDGNTPPDPPPRPQPDDGRCGARADQRLRARGLPRAARGDRRLQRRRAGERRARRGADDMIMLCARAYAGPGDRIAIADEPTYPVYRVSTWVAGAEIGDDDPVLTFVCRPHNPTGALVDLPAARPLFVDEAYFEYAGETAVPLLDDGVIVVRTFSKAFGLASARIGYGLATADVAAELNAGRSRRRSRRSRPRSRSRRSRRVRPTSRRRSPSASGSPTACARWASSRCRRGRTSCSCRTSARPSSRTACCGRGLPVRPSPGAIRITVHRPEADDRLLAALGELSSGQRLVACTAAERRMCGRCRARSRDPPIPRTRGAPQSPFGPDSTPAGQRQY